jgi:hypothetical protein
MERFQVEVKNGIRNPNRCIILNSKSHVLEHLGILLGIVANQLNSVDARTTTVGK